MTLKCCHWLLPWLSVLLLNAEALGQHWAIDMGGAGGDGVTDLRTGPDGYLYATGEFSATMEVAGTTYQSHGGTDVFVAKLDATGSILWLVTAGGPQIDRAGKLAVDATGHLAVTGQFMGASDLFGSALASAGGTLDFFIAVLNTTDGSAQWVRSGGSDVYVDRANGVALSPNGNVTVVGEFKGTATFDGGSLTSMPDPFTLLPSFDAFMLSYDAGGDPLWLKQGSAEFTDRAVDVVSDPQSNIYVCGQFSDTISFDQTHFNAMYNATFILKMDAQANELWFRRCGGGAFNHVRDMLWTTENNLLLAGDLQGTMLYIEDVPVPIQGDDPYGYYLMRVSPDGDHISDTTIGSMNPVTVRSIDQLADTVAVYGLFECQFTDLSEYYDGTGLFMSIGPQDFFVSKHQLVDWTMVQAQQFGSQEEKRAGGVALLPDGEIVFSGSYGRKLFYPATDEYPLGDEAYVAWCAHWHGNYDNNLELYCQDSSYFTYVSNRSAGMKDGFIARLFVRDRSPYDIWERTDTSSCERSSLDLCIRELQWHENDGCIDTAEVCGAGYLSIIGECDSYNIWDFIAYSEPCGCIYPDHIGPDLEFLWSSGETTSHIWAGTGWHSCTVTTANGCWSWTDSIYVLAHPWVPEPLIWDEQEVNEGNPWPAHEITICGPTWLWTEDEPPGYEAVWLTPDSVFSDSILVSEDGFYTVAWLTDNICTGGNVIHVVAPEAGQVPNITGVEFEWFVEWQPDTVAGDTVVVCPNDPCVYGLIVPTWYINGVPAVIDSSVNITYATGDCGGDNNLGSEQGLLWAVYQTTSGWYQWHTTGTVNNGPCGDEDYAFAFTDSIYVMVIPYPDMEILGPQVLCPGDSAVLVVQCDPCDSLLWSDNGVFGDLHSGQVTIYAPGEYQVMGWNAYGDRYCPRSTNIWIAPVEPPTLFMEPSLICPGDTAMLWTGHPGPLYEWLGPGGLINTQNDTLLVTEFGDYYLTTTDTSGCTLTNGPIELGAFSSPFLDVQPDFVLCPGDEVTIEVVTNDPGSIVWAAPLSGSDPLQVITEPGLYSCSVSSCTTETLSAYILGGTPHAEIVPSGPYALCAGDSLLLTGLDGEAVYLWDHYLFEQSLTVFGPGTHDLVVFDELGCTDTTMITIDLATITESLDVSGDTTCAGGNGLLIAMGSGVFTWYADSALTDIMATGDTLIISNALVTTTVFLIQEEGSCTSEAQSVTLLVQPSGADLAIEGPHHLCVGDALILELTGADQASVQWSTPSGTADTNPFTIPEVVLGDAGVYSATVIAEPCPSYTYVHALEISVPVWFGFADTAVCVGVVVPLTLPSGLTAVQWSNGLTTNSVELTAPGLFTVSALDTAGCTVRDTLVLTALPCGIVIPNTFSPNGDGMNEGWSVSAPGYVNVEAEIINRWGRKLYQGDPQTTPWNGRDASTQEIASDGVYYYVLNLTGSGGKKERMSGYFHLIR